MSDILLYTDGSTIKKPQSDGTILGKGPGGWGVVLLWENHNYRKEFSGGESCTTNNRMELTAVIEGLKRIKKRDITVHIYSDSQYVVDAIEKGWLTKWVLKNFKDKKNEDLWREYLAVAKDFTNLKFHWVKGHADNKENNRCDELAQQQATLFSKQIRVDY